MRNLDRNERSNLTTIVVGTTLFSILKHFSPRPRVITSQLIHSLQDGVECNAESLMETISNNLNPKPDLLGSGSQNKQGRPKRHGLSKSPTYTSWQAMIQRCKDPKHETYPRMGGRGIKVCDRWLKFDNFLADVGIRPAGALLTRKDKDSDYTPANCFWGTVRDVVAGNANTKPVTAFNETKTVADWSRDPRCVVPYTVLKSRLNQGWKSERAITVKAFWRKVPSNGLSAA